ncbi:MAG: hypothetical protein CMD67_03935 [Gammaproteobacteria bacterium]|jgi:uncharacterized membrane protein YedE/YeeE|nr:hypothetical protein [Gammaproteobacteria bacterium]
MGKIFSALFVGLVFGFGLGLSQMVNPQKIISFFDFAGSWDPSLAFVMIGAVAVGFVSFKYIPKLRKPIFTESFQLPEKKNVEFKLISGAVIFGIGWGISGFCPGPAISSISYGYHESWVFIAAMIFGAGFGKIMNNYFWIKEKTL